MSRDYRKEYASYHATPEQKRNRALRNAARREAIDKGLVAKGDRTREVDHVKPLRAGGSNSQSNLRVVSRERNRGWRDGKV